MANIQSQIKRNRQNEKRRQRNKKVRSEMKTRINQAVAKGVLHKNTAARRKARLAQKVNASS